MEQEHIFKSNYPDLEFPACNFFTYLFQEWENWNNLTALVCGYTAKELTFKELRQQVEKWCGYFSAKYPKQTIIGMISPNTVEAAVCIMGMMAAGMIYSGISETSKLEDIVRRWDSLNIRNVIIHKPYQDRIEEAMKKIGDEFSTLIIGCDGSSSKETITFQDVLNDDTIIPKQPVEIDPEETMCIIYSSGSTGLPKPMTITHRCYINGCELNIQPDWNPVPKTTDSYQPTGFAHHLYHSYGLFWMLFCSLKLGYRVLVKKMTEDNILEDMEKFKITRVHVRPAMLRVLSRIPNERPTILEHFKSVLITGAPTPQALASQFKEKLPEVFVQNRFGMSETNGIAITTKYDTDCSAPLTIMNNVRVKVISLDNGKTMPVNCKGEVLLKHPAIFTGYLNNPEANAKFFSKDGWCYTGDVGLIDETNRLVLFDRMKGIIKSASLFPIYSSEVESALMSHPGVANVCVVGVPHPEYLEAPRAFVVLEDSSITKEDLHQLVADKLPEHNKLTGGIMFLDTLPCLPSGKVDRVQLKKFKI